MLERQIKAIAAPVTVFRARTRQCFLCAEWTQHKSLFFKSGPVRYAGKTNWSRGCFGNCVQGTSMPMLSLHWVNATQKQTRPICWKDKLMPVLGWILQEHTSQVISGTWLQLNKHKKHQDYGARWWGTEDWQSCSRDLMLQGQQRKVYITLL